MTSPAAAQHAICEQATIDPRALLAAFELMAPVLSNARPLTATLSATGTSPVAGEGDEAIGSGLARRAHSQGADEAERRVATRVVGSHERRAAGGGSSGRGQK
jgi:hypothetical protein